MRTSIWRGCPGLLSTSRWGRIGLQPRESWLPPTFLPRRPHISPPHSSCVLSSSSLAVPSSWSSQHCHISGLGSSSTDPGLCHFHLCPQHWPESTTSLLCSRQGWCFTTLGLFDSHPPPPAPLPTDGKSHEGRDRDWSHHRQVPRPRLVSSPCRSSRVSRPMRTPTCYSAVSLGLDRKFLGLVSLHLILGDEQQHSRATTYHTGSVHTEHCLIEYSAMHFVKENE